MLINCLEQKREKQHFHTPELSSWLKPYHYEVWWVSSFEAKSPSFMLEQTRVLIALYCPCNFPRWMGVTQSEKEQTFGSDSRCESDLSSFSQMQHDQPIQNLKQFSYNEHLFWSGQCWLASMNNCAGSYCSGGSDTSDTKITCQSLM